MRIIASILVPTDFSETADEALRYAAALAQPLGARVSLVHVFDDPFAQRVYFEEDVPIPAAMRAEVLAGIQRRFAERVPMVGRAGTTTSVICGAPASAIVNHARDNAIDLIVMGTHGRHGMAHLLLGSVAERVVRTASCPVLTIRSAPLATVREGLLEACPA